MSDCKTCAQKEAICTEAVCPVCGSKGIIVPTETVQALIKNNDAHPALTYKLCTTPGCNISYFSCGEVFFELGEMNVSIWFKKSKNKYTVCYCRDIELNHIIQTVKALNGIKDKQEILKYLGKEKQVHSECLHKNPTGVTCDKLFYNAIEYAYKLFTEQNNVNNT